MISDKGDICDEDLQKTMLEKYKKKYFPVQRR